MRMFLHLFWKRSQKEQVEERVRSAMASLHTEQQEFLAELSKVQHGLKLLAGALSIPGLEPMSATVNSAAAPKAGSSAPGSHPHSPTHSATSKQTQSMMEPLQALSVPECEEVSPVFGSSLPERSSVSWQSKQVCDSHKGCICIAHDELQACDKSRASSRDGFCVGVFDLRKIQIRSCLDRCVTL